MKRIVRIVALFASVTACGTPLSEAEALFHKGQYPATHQALLELDAERRSWSMPQRAEYALYLGLTLLALGNDGRARVWLGEAEALEDAHPGSLRYGDRRRLAVAIASNLFEGSAGHACLPSSSHQGDDRDGD